MFEDQSKRLEDAMNGLVEDLDKSHLRKMHAEMHMCAAKCCQKDKDSLQTVYSCVENCRHPVDNAWTLVETEINSFQTALSACLENCGSDMRKKLVHGHPDIPDSIATYDRELETCATNCVNDMLGTLPKMLDRMRREIKRTAAQAKR